jgi:hypothetical protein
MQTYAQGPLRLRDPGPLTEEQQDEVRKELAQIVAETGMRLPVRSFKDDQSDYKWLYGGPPDYALANLLYMQGKTMNHPEGSMEQIVEDIVKTWEFERSHKTDLSQHKSMDQKNFYISHDGQKKFSSAEAHECGNYNVLLEGLPEELWKPGQTNHETHETFRGAFAAFPWEVLKVFSGPPRVAFSWRHWGHFTGTYKGNKGKGELINLTGFATATVTADLKLQEVEIFSKPAEFLEALEGKRPASDLDKSALGPGTPYIMKFCPVTGQSGACEK